MLEQEAKELQLFKEWWNIEQPFHEYSFEKDIAEKSWFARSKLDKHVPHHFGMEFLEMEKIK